jgi:hypothetical protein
LAQPVQEAAAATANVPTAQFAHWVAVFAAANLPAAQFVHALLLSPSAANTHALAPPVTPPAVLAAVQAAFDADAPAQLALVPPAVTMHVAGELILAVCAVRPNFPAAQLIPLHVAVPTSSAYMPTAQSMQVVAASCAPEYLPFGHVEHTSQSVVAALVKYSPALQEFKTHAACPGRDWLLPAPQATHVPTPPISAPAVNTHALSAPVTPLAVLAVVQAAVDAVAAAQLALVPPALTAQVPTAMAAACAAVVW